MHIQYGWVHSAHQSAINQPFRCPGHSMAHPPHSDGGISANRLPPLFPEFFLCKRRTNVKKVVLVVATLISAPRLWLCVWVCVGVAFSPRVSRPVARDHPLAENCGCRKPYLSADRSIPLLGSSFEVLALALFDQSVFHSLSPSLHSHMPVLMGGKRAHKHLSISSGVLRNPPCHASNTEFADIIRFWLLVHLVHCGLRSRSWCGIGETWKYIPIPHPLAPQEIAKRDTSLFQLHPKQQGVQSGLLWLPRPDAPLPPSSLLRKNKIKIKKNKKRLFVAVRGRQLACDYLPSEAIKRSHCACTVLGRARSRSAGHSQPQATKLQSSKSSDSHQHAKHRVQSPWTLKPCISWHTLSPKWGAQRYITVT